VSRAKTRTWIDDEEDYVADTIRHYGQFIQYVFGDESGPPFAYTVGLFSHRHAELLILGLSSDTSTDVLNTLADRIRAGEILAPGAAVTFDGWPHRVIPEPVPNPGDIVFAANRYYRRPNLYSVPVLQLSYPDRAGLFPNQPGFATPQLQPRPGTYRA
jgi:Domain of unknown function (DUF4262)